MLEQVGFALVPPPRLLGGWAGFFLSLGCIGLLTAFIGDLAKHMCCCMGISDGITAITFVALGTSLPDTFASLISAQNEAHADAAITNITGSNAVNVFLGLGLPWAIAAIYWGSISASSEAGAGWHARYSGEAWYSEGMPIGFAVPAGDLGFSVAVFCICSTLCLCTLMLRRAVLGFELGFALRNMTAAFFVGLWLAYIGACVAYSSR